jgi:DNA-binding NarL/FixJ family response regulator
MSSNEQKSAWVIPPRDLTLAQGEHRSDLMGAANTAVARVALVVDDDPFFRMALRAILTSHLGCSEVIEAAAFDEAVERLAERPNVTICLFDLAMPGMRSPANLKVIRETFPHTLVVMVSASSARRDIIQALQAGAHGYVPKALGVAGTAAALQSILQGTIYVPPFLSDVVIAAQVPDNRSTAQQAPPRLHTIDTLTPRQRDVLTRLVTGMSNKELARDLKLGEGTIKIHVAALFRNLGVKSRAAAAAAGVRMFQEASRP